MLASLGEIVFADVSSRFFELFCVLVHDFGEVLQPFGPSLRFPTERHLAESLDKGVFSRLLSLLLTMHVSVDNLLKMEVKEEISKTGELPPVSLGDDDVLGPLDALDERIRKAIDTSLSLLVPVEPQPVRYDDDKSGTKYDAFKHAQLCRMKILGLSDTAAARAVGIAPLTLKNWLERRPKLVFDLAHAAELANAQAALLLRGLMHGNDATAFNAIKLFLTTHSPEYRERTVVEVVPSEPGEVLDKIRRGMYGIEEDQPLPDAVLLTPASIGDECRESPASGDGELAPVVADGLDFEL